MGASAATGTVLILAGGTGGHVYPALAVALELQSHGFNIRWLGTERGLESRVVRAAGLAFDCIQVRGLRGKGPLARLQGLLTLLWAACQSLVAVARIKPDCVLGMGGYVSGPAGMAAWLLRSPLVIHEQNSVAGTTNRMLSRFASKVLVAYPHAFVGAEQVGNPVRQELLSRGESTVWNFDGSRPLQLFVVGGSLGAQAINQALPKALTLLPTDIELRVRHQTGVAHGDVVREQYAALGLNQIEILPYVEDMAAMYEWADLVLCRAGALTVAELSIMGRPSILVPLPHAIDDHQAHNASWLRDQGAALVLPQSEMNAETLSALLQELLGDSANLAAMAKAASAAAFPLATQRVAQVCIDSFREVQSV